MRHVVGFGSILQLGPPVCDQSADLLPSRCCSSERGRTPKISPIDVSPSLADREGPGQPLKEEKRRERTTVASWLLHGFTWIVSKPRYGVSVDTGRLIPAWGGCHDT